MLNFSKVLWGPLLAALVFLTACAPPDQPKPFEERSLAAAAQAMRVGDLPRLAAEIGKGAGFAKHAASLAAKLDPDAWLIAIGAASREHDLAQAATAMEKGDDEALAESLGFGRQQLVADMLSGGGSIYSRRADGRNFYESGPQPIDLLDGFLAPALPAGALALESAFRGTMGERQFKVSVGLDASGVTSLTASLDLAAPTVTAAADAARYTNPYLALPATGVLATLDVSSLTDPRWLIADFALVTSDGAIERASLHRDESGWALGETFVETQQGRLDAVRDERLEFLRLRAIGYQTSSGRWPRGFHEISFKPWQLVDPTAPAGRLGWAAHDAKPAGGMALAESAEADYAVICTQAGAFGRRAITRDGRYTWVR